jgi:hypothetical protein
MTRDDFFLDLNELIRLLGRLGVAPAVEAEATQKIAAMKMGGSGVTSVDLRRYTDSIDWARQNDVQALRDLAQVLLRIVGGLASELESFRRARG